MTSRIKLNFEDIRVGQWRRDDFTYVVLAEPDHTGLVLVESRHRGANPPKPKRSWMPANRVLRAEVVDAF